MLSDVELVIDRQNKDAETMSNNQEIKVSSKSNKAFITDFKKVSAFKRRTSGSYLKFVAKIFCNIVNNTQ
jgi:hypothetical protein